MAISKMVAMLDHTCDRPLIGITGNIGSGKDTVGEAIAGWFRHEIVKLSFATRLKQMLATMLDVPYEMMEGVTEHSRQWREEKFEDLGCSPRDLMLTLGTEWGRDMVHPDVWVLLVQDQFDHGITPAGAYFTDVRFENEAKWIKSRGGIVIGTHKPGSNEPMINHRSEAGVPSKYIDAKISAEHGDINGLQSEALKVIKELGCHPSF
jgi:hypothetical protein